MKSTCPFFLKDVLSIYVYTYMYVHTHVYVYAYYVYIYIYTHPNRPHSCIVSGAQTGCYIMMLGPMYVLEWYFDPRSNCCRAEEGQKLRTRKLGGKHCFQHGCFEKLGVHFLGRLEMRALPFWGSELRPESPTCLKSLLPPRQPLVMLLPPLSRF